MKMLRVMSAVMLIMVVGCSGAGSDYQPPDLNSIRDKLTIDDQPLRPGESKNGKVPVAGKYLGFVFQAQTGAVYELSLERLSGSDVPALAIYHFASNRWSDALAWATADARKITLSGWLSPAAGTYLVLVDLASGSGNSFFRLTFSCSSGCGAPRTCSANADCAAGEVCFAGLRMAAGVECSMDIDCPGHEVCVNGYCVATCHPSPEVCDGRDNNCDGRVDEDCQQHPCSTDADCAPAEACINGLCRPVCGCMTNADCPSGFVCVSCQCVSDQCPDNDGDGFTICQGDCDDNDASLHPAAAELCNGRDDDCDGVADEGCNGGCVSDADCAAGQICWQGTCLARCASNSDCPSGQICQNGICQLVCPPGGYADCDKNAANGCETNVLTDAANCGSCGTTCPANQICNGGACAQACRSDADCDDGNPYTADYCVSGTCTHR